MCVCVCLCQSQDVISSFLDVPPPEALKSEGGWVLGQPLCMYAYHEHTYE